MPRKVPEQACATTLLEYLTHPNPPVLHVEPTSRTNTKGKFYWPREVQKWDQFENLAMLKSAFKGRLFDAATEKFDRPLILPLIKKDLECTVKRETKVSSLITKWNHTIVTAALGMVDEFGPSYWDNDGSLDDPEESSLQFQNHPGEGSFSDTSQLRHKQPPRACAVKPKKPQSRSKRRRVPDAGAILLSRDSTKPPTDALRERFPKEYKPALKWSSEKSIEQNLLGRGHEVLQWRHRGITQTQAWPIRQAFTYCIKSLCRYGCILTCRELFLFRIRPIGDKPGGLTSPEDLRQALAENGKMEYVSIPWDNHSRGSTGATEVWTVNLALWFLHVLAGHNFEAAWSYDLQEHEGLGVLSPVESPLSSQDVDGAEPDSATHAVVLVSDDVNGDDENEDPEGTTNIDKGSPASTEACNTQQSEAYPTPMSRKRRRDSGSPDGVESFTTSFNKRRSWGM